MEDKNISRFKEFYQIDIQIKKDMEKVKPVYLDNIQNLESLKSFFEKTFLLLKKAAILVYGGPATIAYAKIEELQATILEEFKGIEEKVLESDRNEELLEFYKKRISTMSLDFLNDVKKECVGYSPTSRISDVVKKANSINELLHFLHAEFNNNEMNLKSIPILAEKENKNKCKICYRGVDVPIFKSIFSLFPTDLANAFDTDIVSIGDGRAIIMANGLGHALSMEITVAEEKARVEYFIPKICNVSMVNALPGINRVNYDSYGATGVFETSPSLLPFEVVDFLTKVPTDKDIKEGEYNPHR